MQNETARVLDVHRNVLRKADRDAEEIFADLRASLGAAPVCRALREAVQSGRLTTEQRHAVLLAASSPPAARTVAAVQETLGVSNETARHWREREMFISRFRELRGAKGSKLSPELRFALAFVAPKVQVGIGASLVPARVLSRTWYTKVQGFYYNG